MLAENILLKILKELDKTIFVDIENFGTRSSHMPRYNPSKNKEEFAKSSLAVVKLSCSNALPSFKKELAEMT